MPEFSVLYTALAEAHHSLCQARLQRIKWLMNVPSSFALDEEVRKLKEDLLRCRFAIAMANDELFYENLKHGKWGWKAKMCEVEI
jgi:hypothetical protein